MVLKSYQAHFSFFQWAFSVCAHFWEAFFNICADHGFDALPGAFQCFSVGVQCLRGSCFEELQGAFQCFSVFARVMVLMRYQAHFSAFQWAFSACAGHGFEELQGAFQCFSVLARVMF